MQNFAWVHFRLQNLRPALGSSFLRLSLNLWVLPQCPPPRSQRPHCIPGSGPCCPTPEWLCFPACVLASGSPAQLPKLVDAIEGDCQPLLWSLVSPRRVSTAIMEGRGITALTWLVLPSGSCGMGGPVSPALSPMEARDLWQNFLVESEENQNVSPPNMPLWHENCFELKATKQYIQENLFKPPPPLPKGRTWSLLLLQTDSCQPREGTEGICKRRSFLSHI